jgi:hypothetical protein
MEIKDTQSLAVSHQPLPGPFARTLYPDFLRFLLNGCHHGECEGNWFPYTPHSGGGWCFFDFVEKNQQTPLQSRGTRLRAVFAVRKQHTKQVTPVEAVSLIVHPNVV